MFIIYVLLQYLDVFVYIKNVFLLGQEKKFLPLSTTPLFPFVSFFTFLALVFLSVLYS